MSNSLIVRGVFLSVVLAGLGAQAGDKLLFKNAKIDTTTVASTMGALSALNQTGRESTTHYVVQFKQKINVENKQWLQQFGEVLRYIPNDAYLIKLNGRNDVRTLQNSGLVQAVVPFVSALKIDENFPVGSVFNQDQTLKMLVSVTRAQDLQSVVGQFQDVELLWQDGKYMVIEGPLGQVTNMAKVDGVEWIQPYHEPQTMSVEMGDFQLTDEEAEVYDFEGDIENLTGEESGTNIMNFQAAWDRGLDGQGQRVAMADTGLDSGRLSSLHPDFEGVYGGQVYGLFATSWKDPMGHGTHVAGSVMGNGARSNGGIRGGAFGAGLLAQGMWSPLLGNLTVPPELKKLYRKSYAEGARIHTNSWGNGLVFGNYDNLAQMTDEYMWDTPDMLIIFAAGNSGVDADEDGRVDSNSVGSPGTAKNVLTVGATENIILEGGLQKTGGEMKDRQGNVKFPAEPIASDLLSNSGDGLAAFSSRGPTDDERLKPEVVAPGTNIVSLCSSVTDSSDLWGRFNDDYCFCGGTSMATPLVAGAAAVARQYLVEVKNIENPSASLVKGVLMNTSTDMFPGQYGFRDQGQEHLTPAPNNDQGYGRVNMANVVEDDSYLALIDEQERSLEGDDHVYTVDVADARAVKVTLVYTDAPGSPSASKALVNNIDLTVTDGNRTLTGESTKNNHEQVQFTEFSGDTITVTVTGTSLPVTQSGAVPYSVIVTKEL